MSSAAFEWELSFLKLILIFNPLAALIKYHLHVFDIVRIFNLFLLSENFERFINFISAFSSSWVFSFMTKPVLVLVSFSCIDSAGNFVNSLLFVV